MSFARFELVGCGMGGTEADDDVQADVANTAATRTLNGNRVTGFPASVALT